MPSALGHIGAGLLQGVGSSMVKKEEAQAKREEQAAAELRAKSLASWTRDNITIPAEERANIQADKTATNLAASKIEQIKARNRGSKKVKLGEMPATISNLFKKKEIDKKTGDTKLDMDNKPIYSEDVSAKNDFTKWVIKNNITDWGQGYNLYTQMQGKAEVSRQRELAVQTIVNMEPEKAVSLLEKLPSADQATLIEDLPDETRKKLEKIKPAESLSTGMMNTAPIAYSLGAAADTVSGKVGETARGVVDFADRGLDQIGGFLDRGSGQILNFARHGNFNTK